MIRRRYIIKAVRKKIFVIDKDSGVKEYVILKKKT